MSSVSSGKQLWSALPSTVWCGVVWCVVPSLKGVSTQCFHGQCSGGGDPVGFSFDFESFVFILVSALPVFEVLLLWSISTT